MNKLVLIALTFIGSLSFGQAPNYQDSLITVKGKVVDTLFNVGFYNLVVIDKTVGKGIFGESNGTFSITLKKGDQIGISVVGYQTIYLSFKDSTYHKLNRIKLFLQPLEYTSEAVIITPLKTLGQLKEERANIAKREVPVVTVSSAISSPITALYIAFSKREKTKRKVAEMEFKDQQNDIVKEILRVYVHNDILELNGPEFEEFITFLHLNTEFLRTATDYELITYIQEKFEHFQKIKEGF